MNVKRVIHFIRFESFAAAQPVTGEQTNEFANRQVCLLLAEAVLEKVQARLDKNPDAMRVRRSTVEHPFGTLKMRMGATHFLMKTLPKVASEMALCVLGYNFTRVLNIVGVDALMAAIQG